MEERNQNNDENTLMCQTSKVIWHYEKGVDMVMLYFKGQIK